VTTQCSDLIDLVLTAWQAESADIREIEGGVAWYPGTHEVLLRCSQDERDDNTGHRIWTDTKVVVGANLDDPKCRAKLASYASLAPTFCLEFTPADVREKYGLPNNGEVDFHTSVCVYAEDKSWLASHFATVSLLSVILAERSAPLIADDIQAKSHSDRFRFSAGKSELDGILFADQSLVEAAKEPSRWTAVDEFEGIAEQYGKNDLCFGFGDKNGLTLEVPFGSDTALIRQHTDIPHPVFGNGLLTTIQLPIFDSAAETEQTCIWLNFMSTRSWTGSLIAGSWHPRQSRGDLFSPAYGTFVPNAMYREGLATRYALWSISLVRWAQSTFWNHLENAKMIDILTARYGRQTE
jgi:hypothetical protein